MKAKVMVWKNEIIVKEDLEVKIGKKLGTVTSMIKKPRKTMGVKIDEKFIIKTSDDRRFLFQIKKLKWQSENLSMGIKASEIKNQKEWDHTYSKITMKMITIPEIFVCQVADERWFVISCTAWEIRHPQSLGYAPKPKLNSINFEVLHEVSSI